MPNTSTYTDVQRFDSVAEMERYMANGGGYQDIRIMRPLKVTHFEDEMTEDERMIAEEKRDSDLYDLRTCHE